MQNQYTISMKFKLTTKERFLRKKKDKTRIFFDNNQQFFFYVYSFTKLELL